MKNKQPPKNHKGNYAGSKRGQYKNNKKNKIKALLDAGYSVLEISWEERICPQQIYNYIKEYGLKVNKK